MDSDRLSLEKKRWSSLIKAIASETTIKPNTFRQAIWKKNKATLWHYPAANKKYDTPIFIIYSLVNKPAILDLLPNRSLLSALTQAGYEVYVMDFGIPRYEDHDMTIDDYILKYIQPGVRKALQHSQSDDISIMGFCLGGTLAAMYAAIADDPIKNLILFVTPIDFSHFPKFDHLHNAIKSGTLDVSSLIESVGVIPAKLMKYGIRLITSPLYLSPYLSLLERGYNDQYFQKWSLFNQWTKEHIPFPGAAFNQLLNDLVIHNKLVKGDLLIGGKRASLEHITANLLVVASTNDALVPLEQAVGIIKRTSSKSKKCIKLPNGHTGLATGAGLPTAIFHWLATHSQPVNIN